MDGYFAKGNHNYDLISVPLGKDKKQFNINCNMRGLLLPSPFRGTIKCNQLENYSFKL